jgi:plastocyanin
VITQADDPTQPYYIVAIDYHFHNAHPTIPLGVDREVIFESDAVNLHNVTIPAIGYSKDLPAGGRIVIPHIGSLLSEPGRYTFYCKYHADRGMAGVIVIGG